MNKNQKPQWLLDFIKERRVLSLNPELHAHETASINFFLDELEKAIPAIKYRRCQPCNAPRNGETCHKCGSETFTPHAEWEEPALPPIERIRELAREVGYAVGLHGTQERDLDVIAAPWTDKAVGNQALIEHIAKGLGARVTSLERKPLGRYAATIQMAGWYKPIDISICPKMPIVISDPIESSQVSA